MSKTLFTNSKESTLNNIRFSFERIPMVLKGFVLTTILIGIPFFYVFSEEEIHYGADSYTVDYDREIIYASGHVYFKSGSRKVTSAKARIYYSDEKQVALFFKNVIFRDDVENVTISGDEGTAYYRKDIYIIRGNAQFEDDERKISANRIEYHSGFYTVFEGNLKFLDDQYEILADSLKIEEKQAVFSGDLIIKIRKNSDIIYCKKLIYNSEKGNVSFTGGTLYVPNREGDPIISSDSIVYVENEGAYNFVDNVYIKGDKYIIRAPLIIYNESEETLYGVGGVFTVMGNKYIESDRLSYSLRNSSVVFSGNVRGVVKKK